jgi:hypothetical protein
VWINLFGCSETELLSEPILKNNSVLSHVRRE